MKEKIKYPDYIGVSEVTTRSYEHMRVDARACAIGGIGRLHGDYHHGRRA